MFSIACHLHNSYYVLIYCDATIHTMKPPGNEGLNKKYMKCNIASGARRLRVLSKLGCNVEVKNNNKTSRRAAPLLPVQRSFFDLYYNNKVSSFRASNEY